jgi:hypothetical protein
MTAAALLLATGAFLSMTGCSHMHRYSNAELREKEVFVFPPLYDTLIAPLNDELIPIYKRIFFLKHDIEELKDRLWDGGSNQRVMKIDDRIDTLRHEVYLLSDIRREILNTIYTIYPAYQTPQVVPYTGKDKKYEKFTKTIILITSQDQREYENAKSAEEKMSAEIDYQPLIAAAMKQYKALPDSLKKPIQPIGTPGGVPRIAPYEPPPQKHRGIKVTHYSD